MPTVIQWICLLLLPVISSAFAQNFPCGKSNVGQAVLYRGTDSVPNSEGTVVVCIEVEQDYQKAAICYDGASTFNDGAAAAVCRQGGYMAQSSLLDNGDDQTKDVSYIISKIQCPVVKNYSNEGETVLLRCSHTPAKNGSFNDICPTPKLAAVKCAAKNITSSESTYNGQVYLGTLPAQKNNHYPYIKLDGQLLPICIDKISDRTALLLVGRSICQQLGYTDVYGDVQTIGPIKDAWYLGSSQCNSTSFPCFTDCFDHSNYSKISNCDGDKVGLDLTCTYNESNAGVYGSGSGTLCKIETTCSTCISEDFRTATYTLIAVASLLLVITCISGGLNIAAVVYIKFRQGQARRDYERVN